MCDKRLIGITVCILMITVAAASAQKATTRPESRKPSQKAYAERRKFVKLVKRFNALDIIMLGDKKGLPKPEYGDILAAVRKLDDESIALLVTGPSEDDDTGDPSLCYHLVLGEIVRRGGDKWKAFIRSELAEISKMGVFDGIDLSKFFELEKPDTRPADKPEDVSDKLLGSNITLLTMLHRLEGKQDPVMILVGGRASRECRAGYPPKFLARLTNIASRKNPVRITAGGDYRSGRQARWRFMVRDSSGKLLPQKGILAAMGGGFVSWDSLGFGESWDTMLHMSQFVDLHIPGKYTVQIVYSNSLTIADMGSIEGLIVCKSLPIALTVKPIEVELSQAERKITVDLIAKLPNKGPIRILGGSYTTASHEFIAQDSAAGKLLKMDWKAAPDLMNAAIAKDIPPTRRAWVLGLLYTITECNNPTTRPSVIGPFSYKYARWQDFASFTQLGGANLSEQSIEVLVGQIDPKKQLAFAEKCWRPWINRKYIKIVKPSQTQE